MAVQDSDPSVVTRRLLSGGAWALGGKLFVGINVLAANFVLARLLSPADLGAYFLIFNGVVLGAVVAQLGMGQTVVRLVAQAMATGRDQVVPRVVNQALRVVLVGAAVVAGAAGLVILIAPAAIPAGVAHAAGLAAMWVVIVTLQGLVAETFRGLHDLRGTVLFSGITAGVLSPLIATVVYTVLWLGFGRSDLRTVAAVAVVAGGFALAVGSRSLYRRLGQIGPALREDESPGLLRLAWPLWVAQIAGALTAYADVWVLGLFRPVQEVAVYGAAVRLATLVVLPFVVINAASAPIIAELYAQERRGQLQRLLQGLTAISMVPAALIALAYALGGGMAMGAVFGGYYRHGAMVLAVLGIGQLVNVGSGPCALTLMMTGHQRVMMRSVLVTSALILCASAWAAFEYGVFGVAVAVAAGMGIQNAVLWWVTGRATGIWTHAAPTRVGEALTRLWSTIRGIARG